MFEKVLYAGWGDMDFNAHMRNTAYLDKSGDVRMMYFAANGFPITEFARLRFGPVIFKDEVEYYKEVHLLDELKVSLVIAALSPDGSRFRLRNEFFRADNKMVARVTSTGGWLDLTTRKLTIPPAGLLATLDLLPKTEDFVALQPN